MYKEVASDWIGFHSTISTKNRMLTSLASSNEMPFLLSQLQTQKIVLASGSPRRKDILEKLSLNVTIIPSQFPETLDKSLFSHPRDYVCATAREKGLEVWHRLFQEQQKEKGTTDVSALSMPDLLISADSIVVLDNTILEKPTSKAHALEVLHQLNNQTHQVYTAVTLIALQVPNPAPFIHTFCECTNVIFGNNSDDLLEAYVESGDGMDKAGGYGYQQGLASFFVSEIQGCFFNVVGFPTHRFLKEVEALWKQGVLKWK